MPKYRVGSEKGPETPNFINVVDLRKYLIANYGSKKGTTYIFKHDIKDKKWKYWATFRTTEQGWNWVGPNRASQWLTKTGNAKH